MEVIAFTSFGAFVFLLFLVVKVQTVTKRLVREQRETRELIRRLEETLHAIHDRFDPEPEMELTQEPATTRSDAMSANFGLNYGTGPRTLDDTLTRPGFYQFLSETTLGDQTFAEGAVIYLGEPEDSAEHGPRRWIESIDHPRDRVPFVTYVREQFGPAIDSGAIQFVSARSLEDILPAIRNVRGGVTEAMNNLSQAMSRMGRSIGGNQRELAALQRERDARVASARRDIAEWQAAHTNEVIEDLREAELLPPKPKTRFERILDDDGCIDQDQ
jgi:hypothetical protein